jgi:hypothetical protein
MNTLVFDHEDLQPLIHSFKDPNENDVKQY